MYLAKNQINKNYKELTKHMEKSHRQGFVSINLMKYTTPEFLDEKAEYDAKYNPVGIGTAFKLLQKEFDDKGWEYSTKYLTNKVLRHAEGVIVYTDRVTNLYDIANTCLRQRTFKLSEKHVDELGYNNYKNYITLEVTPMLVVECRSTVDTIYIYEYVLKNFDDYYTMLNYARTLSELTCNERDELNERARLDAILDADSSLTGYPTLRVLLDHHCHGNVDRFTDYMLGVIHDMDEQGQWDTEFTATRHYQDDLSVIDYVPTKGLNKGKHTTYINELPRQRVQYTTQLIDICTQFLSYAAYFYIDYKPLEVHYVSDGVREEHVDEKDTFYVSGEEMHETPLYTEPEVSLSAIRKIANYYPVR